MESTRIIDVREKEEYEAESILDSVNIPLSILAKNRENISKICEKSKVILMCRSGNRAEMALDEIKKFNSGEAFEIYEGGILAWKNAGKVVNTTKNFHIPIMRQVQIVAGGLVLVFSATTLVTGNISFSFVPAFIGLGLTFAGLSGWCGLAKVLAIMPWNK